MSVQLRIDEMPGYLIVRFIGAGATEEVGRQFESLAEKCGRARNAQERRQSAKNQPITHRAANVEHGPWRV
jgi:hypothetical protein